MRTDLDAQLVSALRKARKEHPCYGVRGLRETVEPELRVSYGKCYRSAKKTGCYNAKTSTRPDKVQSS